jgi:transposase-like protein
MAIKSKYDNVKQSIVDLLLGENPPTIIEIEAKHGISRKILYAWRIEAKKARGDASATDPARVSAQDKFAAIIAMSTLNAADFGEYCRARGLFAERVQAWSKASMDALSGKASAPAGATVTAEVVAGLRRDLDRKNKALAEASALLLLQKKATDFWGGVGE